MIPAFRQYGVGAFMLEDMLRSFPTVRMVTSSPRLIAMLDERGFHRLSRRGSYITMEN